MTQGKAFNLPLAWKIARREFRAVGPGFAVLFLCLALGVAMIAAVGGVSASIDAGLQAEGRRLLGGDIELRLAQRPAGAAERAALEQAGAVSHVIEMRAIVRRKTTEGEKNALAEVKAVDALYPLYDALVVTPGSGPVDLIRRQDSWSVYADPALADRLELKTGDTFRLGEARLTLRGLIEREPDRVASVFALGPRLLMSHDALADSGLLRPGSLVRHLYRLRFNPGLDSESWLDGLKVDFPEAGWRIRGPENAAPGVERFVERLAIFLTLAGLTALLVGGVGIANAVRAHIDSRVRTIAILKCLGAPPPAIMQTYGLQLLAVALAAILTGLALGAAVAYLAGGILGEAMPVQVATGFYFTPLLAAAGFGLLAVMTFSIWPLAAMREIKAASLFRFAVAPQPARATPGLVLITGCCLVGMAGLTFLTIPDPRFAVWFVAGASMAFSCLWAAGHVVIAAVQRYRWRLESVAQARPVLRLALANLTRPGAPALGVFLSLGIGLSALIAITSIDSNLTRMISERVPASAPAYFFIDIRSDQTAAFEKLLAAARGVDSYEKAKIVRGRIVAIADTDAEQADVAPETEWALRGDRSFTVAAEPPPGADIVAGEWWPVDYKDEPLISLDAGLAEGFDVDLGDYLTLNILGRDIRARIVNLRRINWGTLNLNFAVILSPGLLDNAPMNHVYAVQTAPDAEVALRQIVAAQFDNVTPIRVRDALEAAMRLMEDISLAAKLAAFTTLLSGVLVLIGAMAAAQAQALRESAIFKVLGATRRQLRRAYLLEYGLMGAIAAVLAIALGTAGGWGVVTRTMGSDWEASPVFSLLIAVTCLALTASAGAVAISRIYRRRASLYLRNE